jgi:pSer/pThr/pTyr-binding forkhead associated (FHA) protein
MAPLAPPEAPSPTTNLLFDDNQQTFISRGPTLTPEPPVEPIMVAFAVRKRTGIFPSMITVGRTRNQDIVIAHASVSKFHAIFRTRQEGIIEHLELADAGSRNGTWVNDRRLINRGPAVPVHRDDRIRFADIVLTLVDAETLWNAVHGRP